ncbi:MAG: hypothetical protein JWM68_4306 [Verrucomicrobiales bacterium]|nr:hypothetical protein [Verrucomicrobiales bacterium]
MLLISSQTELTTSVTDAVIAIECVAIMAYLRRAPRGDQWRTRVWCCVFGLMALSSFLGALAHGLEMSKPIREALWKPLYLSLGILVALFMVGAVTDSRGQAFARRLVPWGILVGAAFYGMTELFDGAFIVFVIYEATVLVSALGIYVYLIFTRRVKGAGVVALGILLNLIAAAVQASHVSFFFLVPFDHNGVFHLIQMLSTALLGIGLRMGMQPGES